MGRGKHAPEMGSSWSASARSPCTSARMAHATPVRRWQSYSDGATFRRSTRWGDHSFSWGDGLRKSMRCALQYLGMPKHSLAEQWLCVAQARHASLAEETVTVARMCD